MKEFDIVGLGVSTVDLLFVVDELPGTELVQKAHASAIEGGGPVATAIASAARLGAGTAMLDRVGDDILGRMIQEEFRAAGVNTDGIVVGEGRTSSKASILVRERDGARTITYSPGDCGDLTQADVREEIVTAARILHVNGRHWDACLHAVRVARKAGVSVSFDGGAHRYTPQHRELVALADICIVAEEYATSFAARSEIEAAAGTLLQLGPKIVVITQGKGGSWIYPAEGAAFHQEAYPVDDLVDTTGAGDAYHGAFLFGIARGFSLKKAARYASAVGALNTRALGGRSALPTLREVEGFLPLVATYSSPQRGEVGRGEG
ncbi:MAG TPA: carbohydrate kinase [Geobacter sp.]|nr:carbohydrate kinase [Geobacter sp.]